MILAAIIKPLISNKKKEKALDWSLVKLVKLSVIGRVTEPTRRHGEDFLRMEKRKTPEHFFFLLFPKIYLAFLAKLHFLIPNFNLQGKTIAMGSKYIAWECKTYCKRM